MRKHATRVTDRWLSAVRAIEMTERESRAPVVARAGAFGRVTKCNQVTFYNIGAADGPIGSGPLAAEKVSARDQVGAESCSPM